MVSPVNDISPYEAWPLQTEQDVPEHSMRVNEGLHSRGPLIKVREVAESLVACDPKPFSCGAVQGICNNLRLLWPLQNQVDKLQFECRSIEYMLHPLRVAQLIIHLPRH